jgi:hypothetical protein
MQTRRGGEVFQNINIHQRIPRSAKNLAQLSITECSDVSLASQRQRRAVIIFERRVFVYNQYCAQAIFRPI